MTNLIKKLFKGSSSGCCSIKIEEIKTNNTDKEEQKKEENSADENSSCC